MLRTYSVHWGKWLAAMVFAALAACGSPPAMKGPHPAVPAQAASAEPHAGAIELAREMPGLIEMSDVPGLSMAVVQDNCVTWTGAFGTVNDEAQTPLNAETIFEAASLSKPVFAYIVLRLADRGELDLDRPLFEMLEYPRLAHDERYKRITARMVLSHGTGLPNWGGEQLTLRFDPGTGYAYSGEAFVYLQKVLESSTGLPLDALAQREVFQPLGMTHSSFVWQERFAGNAAFARDWLWNVAPVTRYAEANAAGSLLTTAHDYGQFIAALLNGTGLSREMWNELLTPVRESSRQGVHSGLGIGIEDGPHGRTFFHTGNNGRRFTAYMTGDLRNGVGFVYLSSSNDGITLVESISPLVFGDGPPARHRAGITRHDDPRQLASKSVQRIAVTHGAQAARRQFLEVSADAATRPLPDAMLELGEMLAGRGFASLSIEVLSMAVADAPDSAEAHLALGRASELAGDHQAAIDSYRRALAIEPASERAQRRIDWIQERIAAHSSATAVPLQTLERYVGRYGDRQIVMREGRLYYRRGANPEYLLTPLDLDLFELEGPSMFRVRFIASSGEPAAKIMGIYGDGRADESARTE